MARGQRPRRDDEKSRREDMTNEGGNSLCLTGTIDVDERLGSDAWNQFDEEDEYGSVQLTGEINMQTLPR